MLKIFVLSALLAFCSSRSFNKGTSDDLERDTAINVIRHAPRNARLIGFQSSASGPIRDNDLRGMLIDNATLIRDNIVGGFDCSERKFGYYADQGNDCQIFHICVNFAQVYPNAGLTTIQHFAFICPKYTIFTQDSMVCAWEREAIPCQYADQLYHVNDNFFLMKPKDWWRTSTIETPRSL